VKVVIDNIVGSLSNHPRNTGLVVGVISRDHRSIFGYGKASDASAEPPCGDTLFEIGSITKVFTTSLLAILTADGLLKLNEPVRDLMPSLSNLPAEITLLRLASHTAGLPRMPSNLIRSMLQNRRNPYAAYTTADLFLYLSSYKPKQRRTATDQINYSNLGVALLGHILAQSSDSSYEQAIVSRICDKLAMHDTRITLSPEQKERLSTPHSANGKPIQNWDLLTFAGSGALRSTANDMLKFLAANMGRPQSSLTNILQLCHEIRSEAFPPQGRLQGLFSGLFQREQDTQNHRQGVALGWFVGNLSPMGKRVYWHHGATGGYRAFTGFVKSTETGVVVLANRSPGRLDLISSKTSADDIGFRVLEYLNPVDQ
jgi:CubicO group peptidase (beta-lactamase class C family)